MRVKGWEVGVMSEGLVSQGRKIHRMWEGGWSTGTPPGLINEHFWKSGFCPPTEPGTQAPYAPVGWNKILLAALSFHR